MSHYEKTPLIRQVFNNGQTNSWFYVKHDMLQPSGSFKSRGIGHLIRKSNEEALREGSGKLAVFSSSGGNAGLAAATACRSMALNCNVVVPKTTKTRMVKKIQSAGARVIIHGNHWGEADEYLRQELMAQESQYGSKTLYVHPFDDETIWEGHSTIVDEIIQQLQENDISLLKVKALVCSVGGGGLFSGIIKGLERNHLAGKFPVVAVETAGCDVLNKSLKNGSPVILEKLTSVATSLGSPYIAPFAFESFNNYGCKSVVLSDQDVLDTCLRYADDYNFIVEPACGASLHLCYHPEILEDTLGQNLYDDDIVIIIACGGSCMTYEDLVKASRTLNVL
ncbi:ALS_1a_G0026640.mRNA.1.CDS.1 [Saccharomyces cerevisiae]|uniref:L-serine dehydratase n=1 Tax=Saccharomyces paradoxus TaxID=27291 RepID=A0A8B8USX5_SACPA|nr:uncharacterized protein SPAR_I00050 [Saccharomyces paradoxus]EWG85244.1 hypothetical protein R008_I10021 [Saccharomyces cerevisiae R008]CAI4388376.1 AMP_1a_G0026430.mRNA.1.CDS.1 [Saccharomyces cerevisiae]QHS73858.1 hypothetical protein SPAR_I00050 [Saccharomyces paradoxus]CAI4390058.1 ALS_1a_G0026640.mRNA.1.CDS.1 [Saccharomyces cerevisiae]CAI6597005.1 AAB_G0025940.mRNA.1.CDS.1 [Saccharomyces cerevisiae]